MLREGEGRLWPSPLVWNFSVSLRSEIYLPHHLSRMRRFLTSSISSTRSGAPSICCTPWLARETYYRKIHPSDEAYMFAVFPHNLFLFSPAASIISAPYRKFHHPKSTRFQQRFYNYNIYLSRRKIRLRSFRWSIEAILIRWIMLYATDRAKKSGGFPSISTPLFIPWYDLVDMVFSQNTAHFPSRNPFPLCHRVTIPLISFMPSAASVLFWMPHSHHFVQ